MGDFTIEVSSENDKKVISLDADEMEIYIYQETGNGCIRIFEITCNAPGGKVIGSLQTRAKFVGGGEEPDGQMELKTDLGIGIMEVHSNRHGG